MTVEMEVKQKNGSEMEKKTYTRKKGEESCLGPGGKNIWQEFLP
jgi:predicted secreted protein